MGADYLEQDVVATADDQLVVLHDIHLDRVTNVADCFPKRRRADGRFYVRDFSITELRTLRVWERVNATGSAVYPGRYRAHSGGFRMHTLAEEIDLVQQLNATTGGKTGIYTEIKRPEWHRGEGVDLTALVLDQLDDSGYGANSDAVFVQCFDAMELRRIRHDLKCPLKLVQLIGENDWGESDTDYESIRTEEGLASLAETVDAIGPWLNHLYDFDPINRRVTATSLVQDAHAAGLDVHPYTFRADDMPVGFDAFADLLRYFATEQGVDGVFTDFPDKAHRILNTSVV